jgi:hypothetical protein
MSYEQPDALSPELPDTFAGNDYYDPVMSYAAAYAIECTDEGRAQIRSEMPEADRPRFDKYLRWAELKDNHHRTLRRNRHREQAVAKLEDEEASRKAYAELKRQRMLEAGARAELAAEFEEDCYTSDRLAEITPPEVLVDKYLDMDTLIRVVGPSKSLKSFITLDIAGCVAAGIPWHGHNTRKARTLYVYAEGIGHAEQRVRAWEAQNGVKFEAVIYRRAVQLDNEEQLSRLMAFATLGGFGFIVFDTQARCTVGLDENQATQMGVVVDFLDDLRQNTKACVALVHHTPNGDPERGRGSNAVYAALDGEFVVKRDGMTLEFKTTKQKDRAEADELRLAAIERHVQTVRGEETSLSIASGHAADYGQPGEILSLPRLTKLQTKALVALARYDEASPSALCDDLGYTKAERNKVGQQLTRLNALDCAEKVGPKYKINERGWRVLEHLGLTVGYRQVPPLEDDGEEGAAS